MILWEINHNTIVITAVCMLRHSVKCGSKIEKTAFSAVCFKEGARSNLLSLYFLYYYSNHVNQEEALGGDGAIFSIGSFRQTIS